MDVTQTPARVTRLLFHLEQGPRCLLGGSLKYIFLCLIPKTVVSALEMGARDSAFHKNSG